MSLVKHLGTVDEIISIETHLKGDFSLIRPSLFIYRFFWHDLQKGSGSIIGSISSQTLVLSPSNNDFVDLWPNLWCNNSKAILFLGGNFLVFEISFIYPKNACFLCAICGNVTESYSFSPKYILQNSLWNKQVCSKFINEIIENNLYH